MDDDVIESSNSPATPVVSNPGTPRSEQEVRATPPPPQSRLPGLNPANRFETPLQPQSKYGQLLTVIEDMGRDIRPTYAGSKSSAERLKRGIVHARILVRECLMECERSART